jgi:hypothetical protein
LAYKAGGTLHFYGSARAGFPHFVKEKATKDASNCYRAAAETVDL